MISTVRSTWRDARTRAIVWQAVVLIGVGAIVVAVVLQTAANLQERGIASGFAYLGRAAGFEIAPGVVAFSSRDTYTRALQVSVVNTLRVAALGIVISSVLGLFIGVGRLSSVSIVSRTASAYVEVMRNTPLLLQLLFWYSLWQTLPGPADALRPVPGVFLCIRGLYLPRVVWHGGLAIEVPAFSGYGFHGGMSISPEFASLLIGLATCTAAFIAEIVRSGILAVHKGQIEAAAALGLSRARTLRLVVLPQALRVIVPPTTSQYLGVVKNSSLAVAIGYPDLISVTNTTLNQTGQAVEAITVAMTVYLVIALTMSWGMNRYNRSVAGHDFHGRHA